MDEDVQIQVMRYQRLADRSWEATIQFPGGYLVEFTDGVQVSPTIAEERASLLEQINDATARLAELDLDPLEAE